MRILLFALLCAPLAAAAAPENDPFARDKEYPYYSSRPDFIYFSICRKGEQASVVFTVNDPESRSLGVNTGELLAYCYRDGYGFREALEALAIADEER